MHKQNPKMMRSLTEDEDVEVAEALHRTCRFTARFWGNILRARLAGLKQQNFAQYLVAQTDPLNQKLINDFQVMLERLVFEEIGALGYDPENDEDALTFERWVGCLEYGPNTYLAEVAEGLSISVLHFPPRTGWYVSPGKVISLSGEIRKFNFPEESLN
jgi:hypothetical protein